MPLISGISTSERMRSNSALEISSSASRPLLATVTSCSRPRVRLIAAPTMGSSSTTRIRPRRSASQVSASGAIVPLGKRLQIPLKTARVERLHQLAHLLAVSLGDDEDDIARINDHHLGQTSQCQRTLAGEDHAILTVHHGPHLTAHHDA